MENSCRKKYKPSSKKWILASRHPEFRRNSALIPANAGLFHYAGNNPVRYIDPDGRDIKPHFGCKVVKSTETKTYSYNEYMEYSNMRLSAYIKAKDKINNEFNRKNFFDSFASSVSNLDCMNTIMGTGSSSGSGFAATIGLINDFIKNSNEQKKEKAEKVLNFLFIDVPCLIDINDQIKETLGPREILDITATITQSKEYAKLVFEERYVESGRCERNIKISITYKGPDNMVITYISEKTILME
ncbi:MAG: hypothetical protein K6E22_07655 [Treponema sp.]|nr:hypothetical protein [Treponema sp.]